MFYLSQTFAGLAIVGSLLFVGMEVRSSNQVNRHRIIEELLEDDRAVRSPQLAISWRIGTTRYRSPTRMKKNVYARLTSPCEPPFRPIDGV
jgi:hypothetical protein